jgi:Holliday junction resolvasome RuvABC endonuclease subunit
MLRMPAHSASIISIIGIDPGSTCLGTSILWVDLSTMKIIASSAKTFRGDRLGQELWTAELFGDRIGRIASLEEELVHLFRHVQPYMIASESPFMSMRRPQAYGALTEVICAIRRAVMRYDMWKTLYLIDPPTVKKAVGASGNADKEQVKSKLMALPDLQYSGDIPIARLDEHSVDALAVAYGRWRAHQEELCLTK